MKFTLKTTMYGGAVFCVVCLAIAITGFTSLRELTDATQLADARGFAWFWMFLAAVSGAFAAVAWWMARPRAGDDAEG